MDFDQLYPNRFMKAGEFQGRDVHLVIAGVALEELGEGKDAKPKAVLSFQRTKKMMVLNRTNGECLKAMFGRDTAKWIGRKVTFFPAPINDPFTGEATIAIRVRGSPELAADKSFQAKIGRKSVTMTVRKTGTKGATKPAPEPVEEPDAFGVLPDEPGSDFTPEEAVGA